VPAAGEAPDVNGDRQQERHDRAEADVQSQVVDRDGDDQGRGQRHRAGCDQRPPQQRRHGDDDHRNPEEMGLQVAMVAVAGRVLRQLVGQGLHGGVLGESKRW